MAIVRVEKNNYTVDPLYQWDLNQVLEIRGLSMAAVPEVHFTNDAMVRAVRRFATMDAAGVIRVEVPNAVLQTAAKLRALVCIREGEVFKTYHDIRIPVKARQRPADYTITDDEDIYSFVELENLVHDSVATMEKKNAEAAANAANAVSRVAAAEATADAAAATANGIAGTADAANTAAAEAKNTANSAMATAAAKATATEVAVVLSAAGWAGDAPYIKQTVDCAGVTEQSNVVVSPAPNLARENMTVYAECGVRCQDQWAGCLDFYCDEVPSIDLTVNVLVLN